MKSRDPMQEAAKPLPIVYGLGLLFVSLFMIACWLFNIRL